MKISHRKIGSSEPPYIIAELSGNHNGSLETAIRLIESAKWAGADAVKLQAYTPDSITIDHDGPGFLLKNGLWKGRKLFDLYREAHTPPDWFPKLFLAAKQIGITCFSSVFDPSSVDYLETLDCPAYKIASFEITDTPLIGYAASKGKPVIISTGAVQGDEDIYCALLAARRTHVALLHCVSEYPAPNPRFDKMLELKRIWGGIIGFSDHTLGIEAAVSSVDYGASIIERHLKFEDKGLDAAFSSDPVEFKRLVEGVRKAWDERQQKFALRRSLYVVEDIRAGEAFSPKNVRSIRPGHGMHPVYTDHIMGKRAVQSIPRGTPLKWEHLHEADQRVPVQGLLPDPLGSHEGAGRLGEYLSPENAHLGKARLFH